MLVIIFKEQGEDREGGMERKGGYQIQSTLKIQKSFVFLVPILHIRSVMPIIAIESPVHRVVRGCTES